MLSGATGHVTGVGHTSVSSASIRRDVLEGKCPVARCARQVRTESAVDSKNYTHRTRRTIAERLEAGAADANSARDTDHRKLRRGGTEPTRDVRRVHMRSYRAKRRAKEPGSPPLSDGIRSGEIIVPTACFSLVRARRPQSHLP